DFAGAVAEVVCQPFRLRFATADGPVEHIPDVLAVAGDGTWLIDVRPSDRIAEADRVKFAASAEAALACGWRYLVVSGWVPHVAVGSCLVLDGAEWIVEQLEPQYGKVALTRADGERIRVSIRFLVSHPQCRPSSRSAVAADRGRQPRMPRDLSPHQRELAH